MNNRTDISALDPNETFFSAPVGRIRAAAQSVAALLHWDVLLIVRRGDGVEAEEFVADLPAPIRSIRLVRRDDELAALDRTFDVCIVCNRVADEEKLLRQVRERRLARLIVVWAWDNHHSRKRNLQIVPWADLVLPAHRFCAPYLLSPHTVLGRHVPLASYQWSRARAAALFERYATEPRENALHGGFFDWRIAPERAATIATLQQALPNHALTVQHEVDRKSWFGRTADDRWLDWARHKVGLILPFRRDLSTRFFDSLLTGQVPLVPAACADFDHVVDPAAARQLPVVRIPDIAPPAVEAGWREALALYDRDGVNGARRRHRYALEHHHIAHRLAPICAEIRLLGAPDARIETEAGMGAVGAMLKR